MSPPKKSSRFSRAITRAMRVCIVPITKLSNRPAASIQARYFTFTGRTKNTYTSTFGYSSANARNRERFR